MSSPSSSSNSSAASSSSNSLAGGCPVAHHGKEMPQGHPNVPFHPHQHTLTQTPAASAATNPLAQGCPVAHHGGAVSASSSSSYSSSPHPLPHAPSSSSSSPKSENPLANGCPVAHSSASAAASKEPRVSDSPHSAASSFLKPGTKHPFQLSHHQQPSALNAELPESGEMVPPNSIPAAGRGNSDDGKEWLNPSANQLYRALARKEKPIEPSDAGSVAAVHVAVTDNTWKCIMEYEQLHAKSCPKPTLARFQGMDGIFSFKAKIMMNLWGMRPFDRHDWYVNRCGKEVKYVIDYYSFETPDPVTGETSIDYFIDARPAPTIAGMFDRARVAFQKWKRGEKIF